MGGSAVKIAEGALCVLLGVRLLGGGAGVAAQSLDVEREIEEAGALCREGKLALAAAKLEGVIARLERLQDLEGRKAALADAALHLAFSYVALGETRGAAGPVKAAILLDPGRRLHPEIYGRDVLALFSEAMTEVMGTPPVTEAPVVVSQRAYGSLAVASADWIEVSVDGGPQQQTPVFLPRLAVGRHTVRASRSGFKAQVVDVDIPEGDTRRLRIALERE